MKRARIVARVQVADFQRCDPVGCEVVVAASNQ